MKTLGAAKAKTQFLALLDEVQKKRIPVLVTKNGKPVAQLVPVIDPNEPDPIFGFMRGRAKIIGDITAPIYTDEEYEEFHRRKDEMYGGAQPAVRR